jgi:hypothetical protein
LAETFSGSTTQPAQAMVGRAPVASTSNTSMASRAPWAVT